MTKAAALFGFYSSFDVPAYEENSVPTGDDAPELPYLTYNIAVGDIHNDTALTASLWYAERDGYSALREATDKAEEICTIVGRGGHVLPCDGGAIWIRLGIPKYQIMGDNTDPKIKRVYMNFTASYLTAV